MNSEPPLPPYQPPGSLPPRFPSLVPPERKRALRGDIAIKVLIISPAVASVGFGLCSIAALATQASGKGRIFVGLGAGAFFLGLLGIVVGVVWLLISTIADWNQR
jgi:hypothetical protein